MTHHLRGSLPGPTALLILFTCLFSLSSATPSANAAGAPLISVTKTAYVSETSARIEATVNPQGKATKYQLDYVDQAGFEAAGFSAASKAPVPPPTIPAEAGSVPVTVQIGELSPATTYHYRLRASSTAGASIGPEQTFTTSSPAPIFAPCPNDALRTGPSARLPDCRAYEQATPLDKNGGFATGVIGLVKAAIGGNAVTYISDAGIPGGEGSQEMPVYLASREAGGWSNQGLLPPASAGQKANVIGWTPDLSQVFDDATRLTDPEETTFLARPSDGGPLATIVDYTPAPSPSFGLGPRFVGASPDGSQVLFESRVKLDGIPASIQAKSNVYLWDRESDQISLAGVFNDGTAPPQGAFAGSYDWVNGTNPASLANGGAAAYYYSQEQHVFSSAGSLYFTAAGTGQLYLRENPSEEQSALDIDGNCTEAAKACTIHVSATEKTNGEGTDGADAAGTQPAAFMGASSDGSRAFFTSTEKLTDDATTGPEPLPAAIARANLGDGSGADLGFLPASAKGLAVDGTYIYWADPKAGTIGRATLDGETEVDPNFIEDPVKPQWVTTDSEHIYWTDAVDGQDGHGTIGRATLDGTTEVKPDFITGAHNPQGIAVNATHIYWVNDGSGFFSTKMGIARAKISGEEVIQPWSVDAVGDPAGFPMEAGLTLDATYLYAPIFSTKPALFRIKLSEPKDFKGILLGEDPEAPVQGIAIDANHIYWADEHSGTIGRAKLNNPGDLIEVEEEFIKGAGHPHGLAIDANHIYWSANQEVVPNNGNDLYRYDAQTGTLSDLVVDHADVNGADVLGVLGTSEDGSHVYFAANGVLTSTPNTQGESAAPGDCKGTVKTASGSCSLYLWHEEGGQEEIEFIARLNVETGDGTAPFGDAANWAASPNTLSADNSSFQKTSRVSPDGRTLLFRSRAKLGDYENNGTPEFYRYRVGEGLACVSCNPTGAAPRRPTLASLVPSALYPGLAYASLTTQNLSADGERVFFETADALLGADVNGEAGCPFVGVDKPFPACQDVYEWEAEGSGSCQVATADGGCLYLLSSGMGPEPSFFADASASGEDAFIFSREQLVGQDQDQLQDVYDVRVGGGLQSQNPTPTPICEAEGCKQGASPPPPDQSPGSASFSGPGNAKGKKPKPRCAKGKRRAHGKGKARCVKRKGRHRAHPDRGARR